MKVYSSFSNTLNFERSRVNVETLLKRYALLYESVIFNRHGCPIGQGGMFADLQSYIGCALAKPGDWKGGLALSKHPVFREIFIDMWDLFENPESVHNSARDYLSKDISDQIHDYSWYQNAVDEEMGLHNHRKEYKAAAIVAGDIVSDLSFNLLLADQVNDFNMSLAPVIGDAFGSVHNVDNEQNLFTTQLVIPDFESLSWDQILELRKDKYITNFRDKVHQNVGTGVHPDDVISTDLQKALWDLADQCEPNVGSRLLEMFLSNLPLPSPVNPFSYFYGSKAIAQDAGNLDKRWIYFVQRLQKLS